MRIYPVLCASALHNIGTDLILNFVNEFMPAPTETEGMPAVADSKEISARVTESGPCSAFVFKTTADPFAGRISYFKVVTGVLKNDANLTNLAQGHRANGCRISAAPQGKTITR